MTLPEIPDEVLEAAENLCESADVPWTVGSEVVRRVWPHLYAAALRHAADDERVSDSDAVLLRAMADEAERP